MKAQQVKNAVIVPVGAKGGFVPRQLRPEAGREAVQAEGEKKGFASVPGKLVSRRAAPPSRPTTPP